MNRKSEPPSTRCRRLWAVVPAAGCGSRMAAALPKQYLRLGEHTIIEHTLQRLAASGRVAGIVVAIAPEDNRWRNVKLPAMPLETVTGGAMRHESVLNALRHLQDRVAPDDWVLVHDAARPCVRMTDIGRLVDDLWEDETGGLLGMPVADTMKRVRAEDRRVQETVPRADLWHALTPQMFRRCELQAAIEAAVEAGFAVTDEASAMEYSGRRPRMVCGARDNIKITTPQDLELARLYLARQQEEAV
ncbi:MAG: 2-C-methyl-D-erythritol 4-phosphate cytidylyltransferase [Gammaproteobacteria bacterium]